MINVEIASFIVAGLAVVVGPLVSLFITKRQIWASTVSSNRQVWINDLRMDVAEYLQQKSKTDYYSYGEIEEDDQNIEVAKEQESAAAVFRVGELKHLIMMRLNPNEKEHKALIGAIETFSKMADDSNIHHADFFEQYKDAKNEIIQFSQAIFKKEWEIIKGQK